MPFRFIFFIAKRYFFSSKGEKFISFMSFLAIITIALSVFTLIVVMAFMDAMKREIINSIISYNGEIVLNIKSTKQIDEILGVVSKLKFVKECHYEKALKGFCVNKEGSFFTCISGVKDDLIQKHFNYDTDKIKKDLDNSNNLLPAFISSAYATRFNLKTGDIVSFIDDFCYIDANILPKKHNFKIIAISNVAQKDNLFSKADKIFTLNYILEKQFTFSNNIIQISTFNPENVFECSKNISSSLTGFNFSVNTWQDNNENFINALNIEKNCMFLILTLMLILASFVMMSTLFMFVREKLPEICILRTIGVTKFNILCIFLLNGIFFSLAGIFLGSCLAYVFLRYFEQIKAFLSVYQEFFICNFFFLIFKDINIVISASDFTLICFIAFLISLPAIIYPSLKASSFNLSKGVKM